MTLDPRTRFEILDILAEYCRRVDQYDIEAMAELFTEDCVTDYGPGRGGEVTGRENVRARIAAGQKAFRRTHHQLGQTILEGTDDPTAVSALTYVTAWHEDHAGVRHVLALRYVDRLEHRGQGWRLARRAVQAAYVDGFPDVDWAWVDRQDSS